MPVGDLRYPDVLAADMLVTLIDDGSDPGVMGCAYRVLHDNCLMVALLVAVR
ncbi:hypothetical protein AB5N19_09204 [Seiridium cardinale]